MERTYRAKSDHSDPGQSAAPALPRRAVILAGAAILLARPAFAQTFPSRPIRILIGFGAGGATDMMARFYGPPLSQLLGVPVIVDNRPGGSQLLAIRGLLAAPPDGYTLFLGTGSSLFQEPGVRTDLPYDPIRDFTPIGMLGATPALLLVNPQLPVHSVAELLAYIRANPGKLNFGSAGVGSASHLQMEMLKQAAGLDLVHIPFRADQDVTSARSAGGALQLGLAVANGAVALVESGRLRAIGVVGTERIAALPDVPTLSETGIDAVRELDSYTMYGLVGPAGLSAAIADQLNEAALRIAADADFARRMRERFFVPVTSSPAGLRQLVERELPRWRELGKSLNLQMSGG